VLDRMLKVSLRDRFQSAVEIQRALELEPHLSDLQTCMNLRLAVEDVSDDRLLNSGRYLPPTVRTAIAIRRWQSKVIAKGTRKLVN